MYPIVIFDAIGATVRDNGQVVKMAICIAPAPRLEGKKELLGLPVDQDEGARFWLGILMEVKNRGARDILIAVMNGPSGFSDTVRAVHPATEAAALQALENFRAEWDAKYPMIARSWESRWTEIVPFLGYGPENRKVIYTTNSIESLNGSTCRVTRNRRAFPAVDAATKLVFLASQNISRKRTMPIRERSQTPNQLADQIHRPGAGMIKGIYTEVLTCL